MNRWLAAVLALIAGALAAFAAAIAFTAVAGGFLWIYVFGDNPWPSWVDPALGAAMFAVALSAWAVVAWIMWRRLTARRRQAG